MKTNKWLIAFLAVTTLFTACEEMPKRGESPKDKNAIQAYIFENTSNVTIKPASGGRYFMDVFGDTATVDTKVFNVMIGRNLIEKADSFELQVVDAKGVFNLDKMVRFKKGAKEAAVKVEVSLDFGQSATLVLTIPDEYTSSYASSTKTINVNVDYTWVPKGKVRFISSWEAAEGSVAIEKAQEFSNTAGDSLYRLNSPYFVVAPDYCQKEGKHLLFYLHSDYSASRLPFGLQEVEDYPWSIFWAAPGEHALASYCNFVSSENVYAISMVWVKAGSPSSFSTEKFVWEDGYLGTLTNPTEGEGVLSKLTFTNCTLSVDSLAVSETIDEILGTTEEHHAYTLTFSDPHVDMNLVLVGDSLGGTFKIESNPVTAGSAVAGYYDGVTMNGCYLDMLFTKYYMASGEVQVDVDGTNYTITVKAKTAADVEIESEFTGTLSSLPPSPVPGKPGRLSMKRINL